MQRIGPIAVALSLGAFVGAQENPAAESVGMTLAPEPVARQEVRNLRLGSGHVRHALRTLSRELEWHRDLEDAAEVAREADKPILWIQALGDLQGFA